MRARDTWADRDFPVLVAVVEGVDATAGVGVRMDAVAERTGLPVAEVVTAARALADADLIEIRWIMGNAGAGSRINRVSGQARQLTGAWPSAEGYADRLIEAVDVLERNADSDEERSRLQKLRDALGSAGRDLLVSITASVISGQIPR